MPYLQERDKGAGDWTVDAYHHIGTQQVLTRVPAMPSCIGEGVPQNRGSPT